MVTTSVDTGPINTKRARRLVTIDPTVAVNQGDLVMYDTAAHLWKAVSGTTDGRYVAGVSEDQNPIASLAEQISQITIVRGGSFRLQGKSGETYEDGSILVIDSDAQHVRLLNVGGGDSATDTIGYVVMDGGGTVVAGSATFLEFELRVNYPAANVPVNF